jgi:hypothetical protein
MPNYPAKIAFQSGFIKIGLPLTNPTGKIRVKEKSKIYDYGKPFATRQNIINNNCYLEWQIGYDSLYPDAEGVVREIKFIRKGEVKYGSELTNILYIGIKNHIYPKSTIEDLLNFAGSVNKDKYIDMVADIQRTHGGSITLHGLEFQRIGETYPVFFLAGTGYDIEVEIKHKQRAVGSQSMIYVCLPIKGAIEKNIIGRTANPLEVLNYKVDSKENNFVYETFKVFALASHQHNEDIRNILNTMKKVL